MALIEYPTEGFISFISLADAEDYFAERLNADAFLDATAATATAALITAFRALSGLSITIDPSDATELQAIKDAQCEQALHELRRGEPAGFSFMGFGGLQITPKETPRFSEQAVWILKPYLAAPVLTVTR